MQPYISGTGGQGTSRRILGSYRFQVVPIVSTNRKNGNACQHSPEHGNKMYERGGSCTSVQPYISGTGGQGTSRRILGSYRFQVVPIVSSSRENGNACQHSPEHGNKMYERGGELHISAAIHFRYWGAGHIQENPRVV